MRQGKVVSQFDIAVTCGESSANILHVDGCMNFKMTNVSRADFLLDCQAATRNSVAIDKVAVMETLSMM